MNAGQIREIVLALLSDIAPEAEFGSLAGDADLREALDLDSIDFQNFVIALHERTRLPIPESDYSRLSTLDGVVAYLSGKGVG